MKVSSEGYVDYISKDCKEQEARRKNEKLPFFG
jgi:hypothetical protein